MKPLILSLLALLLASPLSAADLSQVITAVSKYESGADAEPLRQIERAIRETAGQPAQRAAVEAALIQLLAPSSTFEARRFACVQLAAIGTEASLPALAKLLEDPETMGIACLALGSNPSPQVNELLRAALSSAKDMARIQIIVTLGDRGDTSAVTTLTELARNSDRMISEAAIGSLGKIANEDALKALAALRQGGERVRAAVEASLVAGDNAARRGLRDAAAAIYEELLAASQPGPVRRAAFEGLLRIDPDQGEQRALTALRGADAPLKTSALAHVRSLPSPGASAQFAQEMARLSPSEQVLMIESLAARNDDAARAAVAGQLSSKDASVRRAAAMAFTRTGDATSVPALAKALGAATQAAEQQTIEMAMASLKGGAAVDHQIMALLKSNATSAKASLISVLARRGSSEATPVLLDQAGSPDAKVASAAFRALGKLASIEDLPALLDKLVSLKVPEVRNEAEGAAIQVITRTSQKDRASQSVLSALGKARDVDTRSSLISLLPATGGAPALAAVRSARADQERAVRESAFQALTEWPDASAIDALLETASSASQNSVRVLALRGAVRLLGSASEYSSQEIASRFQRALSTAQNNDEKKLVLGGLAQVHDPVALNLVTPLLNDPAVQAEAALATVKLAPYVSGAAREETRAALRKVAELPVDKAVRQSASDMIEVMKRFEDFILAWQVSGPYAQPGKDGRGLFDVVFPPETTGKIISQTLLSQNPVIHPAETEEGMIPWQTMPAGTRKDRPWQLDLGQLYPGDQRVAYARTWLYSDKGQPARLEFGSDDGIKAWLNGKVILSANRGGDVVPATDKVPITLRQGWNLLLLKVTQWNSGWGFCARVAQPDGSPLEGVRAALHPAK